MLKGGGRIYIDKIDVALVAAGLFLTVLFIYAIKTW